MLRRRICDTFLGTINFEKVVRVSPADIYFVSGRKRNNKCEVGFDVEFDNGQTLRYRRPLNALELTDDRLTVVVTNQNGSQGMRVVFLSEYRSKGAGYHEQPAAIVHVHEGERNEIINEWRGAGDSGAGR